MVGGAEVEEERVTFGDDEFINMGVDKTEAGEVTVEGCVIEEGRE